VFFVLEDLRHLHHLYHYSLTTFMHLFKKSVSESREVKGDRTKTLWTNLAFTIYRMVAPGLLAEDRLVLAFRLMEVHLELFGKKLAGVAKYLLSAEKIKSRYGRPREDLMLLLTKIKKRYSAL
jgi:hypothetical protein